MNQNNNHNVVGAFNARNKANYFLLKEGIKQHFPQIMTLLKMCMRMHQDIKLTKFYSSINSLIPSALT